MSLVSAFVSETVKQKERFLLEHVIGCGSLFSFTNLHDDRDTVDKFKVGIAMQSFVSKLVKSEQMLWRQFPRAAVTLCVHNDARRVGRTADKSVKAVDQVRNY